MITAISIVFALGYFIIAFEHKIHIDKTAIALLSGVFCWVLYIFSGKDAESVTHALFGHLGDISGILFFLMGAMTIVELIDAHNGFDLISRMINTTSKKTLIWVVGGTTFFLSAILDNLTSTIIMVSLLRKLVKSRDDRLFYIGIVIIAANSGGAWSPIGDVTTTMLWIGGQVTTVNLILKLLLPSILSLVVPMLFFSYKLKGNLGQVSRHASEGGSLSEREKKLFLFTGLGLLLFVPVFKTLTHLPPFMGMLFSLAILWILSEIIHRDKSESDKGRYSVMSALRKIDMPSVLFFLGILIGVAAMQSAGQLTAVAKFLDERIGHIDVIVILIGLLSAIVDNVPLVAAAMGMYDKTVYPENHYFWEFLAYCAGTGGSILIIGSAAGVAAMGMEKIGFFWYLRKVAPYALIGFLAGALFYIMQHQVLHINLI